MAVVDTSFLIALVKADDHFHQDADLTRLRTEHLLVPWEVWVEFCEVIQRFADARRARAVLDSVLAGPFEIRRLLEAEELAEMVASAEPLQTRLARAGRKPLSLFDLVVCRVAQRLKESILTFDSSIMLAVQSKWLPGTRLA